MSDTPLIRAQNLSVHYPLRGNILGPAAFVAAVNNINLEIAPGSFFGLVGESGSGKTTLGRAMYYTTTARSTSPSRTLERPISRSTASVPS